MKILGHGRIGDVFEMIIQKKKMWSVANLSLVVNMVLIFFPHLVIKHTAMNVKVSF
jgi:hypothetical protein